MNREEMYLRKNPVLHLKKTTETVVAYLMLTDSVNFERIFEIGLKEELCFRFGLSEKEAWRVIAEGDVSALEVQAYED